MKRTKIFISIMLILLVLGDIITTKVVLQSELVQEGNPIARFMIENNIFIIIKIVALLFILFFVNILVDDLTKLEITSLSVLSLVLFIAVLNNTIKIIQIY